VIAKELRGKLPSEWTFPQRTVLYEHERNILLRTVPRMKTWAEAHPWCDSQGITDDEWESLAAAAHGFPEPHPRVVPSGQIERPDA
jgi:hypothetical protein